ncbi:MAG: hypothetical protein ACOH1I_10025 [Gallionellaceae bacterium]|jgi:hypothetical protein
MQRFSWQDYKTLVPTALGGALEFYDFIIYAFFVVVIKQVVFSGLIFSY